MITARAFAGKRYAVYGLARSGLATVAALIASGAEVTAWDDNAAAREKLCSGEGGKQGPGLCLRRDTEWNLSEFDALVLSPGVPLNRHPLAARAREANLEIIGDIELFARARPGLPRHKVVGITGTNGKSTTTALVHHILEYAGAPTTMGGNIGLPILAQDPLPEGGVYVLELSSYQIDLTQSLDCDVAVLLNITPDHLDRYQSFEAYARSKLRLLAMQSSGQHAVVTENGLVGEHSIGELIDEATLPDGSRTHWPGLNVAMDHGASFIDGSLFWDGLFLARQRDWPSLQGPHNAQNVIAALTTCILLGVEPVAVVNALRAYPGLLHRMERVREKDRVVFVNDSKATNPTATAPALAAFDRIRWICGGQAKTDDLDECASHFGHVASAYTIGEAAHLFERLLAPHMPVKNCGKLDEAVRQAAADAQAGDTVLLSPACASFDQFRDFEDRGEQFRALVGAL